MKMMVRTMTIAGVAGLGLITAAAAQAQQPAERPAEALGFLIGEWEGTGWAAGPGGQRGEFRVHELIESRAAGHAVSLQGRGWARFGPDAPETVVHDAFGLIWAGYDGAYHIRSVVMQGHTIEGLIDVNDSGFQWGFDAGPMGETRYTTTVEDGVWHEVGERRANASTEWEVFLEMTLERAD